MKRKFLNKKKHLACAMAIISVPFFGFIGFAYGSGDNAVFPLWLALPGGILVGAVFGYSGGIVAFYSAKYFYPDDYYE